MESKDTPSKTKEQEKPKLINLNEKLKKLKSDYFVQKLFGYMTERASLEIIKYNKSIQKRINIDINQNKEYSAKYSSIELEIIPMKNKYGQFINVKGEDKEYYHIYFNDNKKKEIKRTSLNKKDKVSKINIIIDYQVESFSELFYECKCIESINFTKFCRNNITSMNAMFFKCTSLTKLNFNNFNTSNVTDLGCMFFFCSSLKELNLNNFKTSNVTNMNAMFSECSSLKKLNLNNFNTNKVTDMSYMFDGCSALKELNLNNFNTTNVTNMIGMFDECTDDLKLKIKIKYKNFNEKSF